MLVAVKQIDLIFIFSWDYMLHGESLSNAPQNNPFVFAELSLFYFLFFPLKNLRKYLYSLNLNKGAL